MAWFNRNLCNKVALIVPASFCIAGEALALNFHISFSIVSGVTPVPFSPWAMAGLSALVALLAGFVLRRQTGQWNRSLTVLLATCLLITFMATTGIHRAHAVPDASSVNLILPSPMATAELVFQQDISIVNTTGQAIRIDSIEIGGPFFPELPPKLTEPSQQPRCVPGLVVSSNSVCYAKITY